MVMGYVVDIFVIVVLVESSCVVWILVFLDRKRLMFCFGLILVWSKICSVWMYFDVIDIRSYVCVIIYSCNCDFLGYL